MEIEFETKIAARLGGKREGICTGSSNPLNAIVRGKRGEAAARNFV